MSDSQSRRRWITLGETIALLALIVSAAGLWLTWQTSGADKPTKIVEQRQPIPLTLRGKSADDGRRLQIEPVEDGHALQSLSIRVPGSSRPIEVGSDGELGANDLGNALGKSAEDGKGTHRVRVRIDARYVEMGADRRSGGNYVLSYRWEGGGLFGGRSLKLVGLSR